MNLRLSKNQWIQVLISLGVAFFIFWLLYKDISLEALIEGLAETSLIWLGLSIVVSIFGFWLRAWRWKLLIGAGKEFSPPTSRVFGALMIGYLVNLLVPRAGEVARCGALKKTDDIEIGHSLGTVILERSIDLIFLIITIILAFTIERELFLDLLSQLVSTDLLLEKLTWVLPILLGGLIGTILLFYFLGRIYRDKGWLKKIRHFVRELMKGLVSLGKVKNQIGFWLSSITIWITYYFTMFFVALAIPYTAGLSPSSILMVMVMGSIGMVAPVQGGIGTFHALVAFILMAYGLTDEEGKIFAVIIHGSQVLTVIGLGLLSLGMILKYTAMKEPKSS